MSAPVVRWVRRVAWWLVRWLGIPSAAVAVAFLVVWGLVRQTEVPVPDSVRQWFIARGLGPPPEPMRTDAIRTWLTCADCAERDLDAVLALARDRPDSVVGVLAAALLEGPSAYERRALTRALRRIHARDTRYLTTHEPTVHLPPVGPYVALRVHRFGLSWRARAAIALGQIGTPPAIGVLDSARTVIVEPQVLRAIAVASDTVLVRESLRHARGL